MHDKQITDILTQTGFTVGVDGIVSDGAFVYGTFHGEVLSTPANKKIDLGKMLSIQLNKRDHKMSVEMEDGVEVVAGGPPSDSIYVLDDSEVIHMGDMPQTTLDLDRAFRTLFPDYKDQLYYDELKERDMIDMAMLGCPEQGVIPVTDRVVKLYHRVLQERLRACGFIGKRFPTNLVMDEVLDIKIGENKVNPFRDWVEKQTWDGIPRLKRVMMDYFGATAPALRKEDDVMSDDEISYLEKVTEAWFLGAIARMYKPTQHDIVPVLIGVQGGGKGSGLRFLAGDDEWYAATTADVTNPEKFLESVRGAIIVEMGESKQIRGRSSQEDLKAFISQREDRIRKKYARYEETFPRHFILAATANNDAIFVDPTGARRFYPMYCRQALAKKEIAVRHRGTTLQYEVEQIWAEALHEYRQGVKPYVGKEIDELARVMQKEASIENPMAEMITDWVDDPVNGYTAVGSKIYRDLIMEEVFEVDPRCAPPNVERAWAEWVDSDRRWEKCKPFSHRNKTRRGFMRMIEPEEKVRVETLKLVDGDEPEYNYGLDIYKDPDDPDYGDDDTDLRLPKYEEPEEDVTEAVEETNEPVEVQVTQEAATASMGPCEALCEETFDEEEPEPELDPYSRLILTEALDVVKRSVDAWGLKQGDRLPMRGLTQEQADLLRNAGYIEQLAPGSSVYYVGVIP